MAKMMACTDELFLLCLIRCRSRELETVELPWIPSAGPDLVRGASCGSRSIVRLQERLSADRLNATPEASRGRCIPNAVAAQRGRANQTVRDVRLKLVGCSP